MYMNPGDIIAITQIAFKGASIAVDSAYKALKFFEDSETLVVQLELERFRLRTWGINSGVEHGKLPSALLIIHQILCRELDLIKNLFQDANKLRDRYLMLAVDSDSLEAASIKVVRPATKDDKDVRLFLKRMRKSLRGTGLGKQKNVEEEEEEEDDGSDAEGGKNGKDRRVEPGIWNRMRWGIRDKEQFSKQVTELHDHVNILHQLLSEIGRQKSNQDEERIKIIVVGSAVDARSLELIRSAVAVEDDETRAMVERKALSEPADPRGSELASRQARKSSARIKLSDLSLPKDYGQKQRLLARWKEIPDSIVLLEKKAYDPDLHPTTKKVLSQRVQRLTVLLSSTQAPSMKTPKALDYITDDANFCWWLVSEFPASLPPPIPLIEPLTLYQLLQPSTKFKPPLEQRLQLAVSICGTMSCLYSSGWLHKNLKSANILFLWGTLPNAAVESSIICEPLVSGFEYSRQETEMESINNAMMFSDVAAAMYRHPLYQGEAAQGYCIEFDIYSLGLVLVEIALWVPLASFLDAKNAAGQKRFPSKMEQFHRAEALILKNMVLDRLEKEFAFRLGTVYYEAVKWCLTLANHPLTVSDEDSVHPALEFYNNVLARLQGLRLTS